MISAYPTWGGRVALSREMNPPPERAFSYGRNFQLLENERGIVMST
jgi:hypothetical protein